MHQLRVFVSYSRSDGSEAAANIRGRLNEAGLGVWQDLVALEGGRDWWTQIEEALRSSSLQHFVLVVTPTAMASPHVRSEIRLARQEGKHVHPVRGPGFERLDVLPRWLGHVIDPAIAEQWRVLIDALRGDSRQKRVPMMALEPPADFVPRPHEFEQLKRALLDEKGDARCGSLTAITAALKGAGGYGKTTLAKALSHDPDVLEAFFDGVLWVELGERPANLLGSLIDLIQRLSGVRPALENINAAATALGEELGDRRILLVIDDAWAAADLRPFLQGGSRTTRLVTTRLDRVVPDGAYRFAVDAMQPIEAVNLLKTGLPKEEFFGVEGDLARLSAQLGEWAQLLKLANGFLRNRVSRGEALSASIVNVNRRLNEKGLTAFDARSEGDRTSAVARTIEVSLDLLDGAARSRFAELAVFPEDVDVPIDVAAAFWSHLSGLIASDTEDLLTELHGLSLLVALDFAQHTFRLHDTTRAYLRTRVGVSALAALNAHLVTTFGEAGANIAVGRYDVLYRASHLHEAGDRVGIDRLLTDPAWIVRKVTMLEGLTETVADYERFVDPAQPLQPLVGRTLRLIAGVLADLRASDLAVLVAQQLTARLLSAREPAVQGFLSGIHASLSKPWLVPTVPCFEQADSALLTTISGYKPNSYNLRADWLMTPDDRALVLRSGSELFDIWQLGEIPRRAFSVGSDRAAPHRILVNEGAFLVTGGEGIAVWRLSDGALQDELLPPEITVQKLVHCPEAQAFAALREDGSVGVWDEISLNFRFWTPPASGDLQPLGSALARISRYKEAVPIEVYDLRSGATMLSEYPDGKVDLFAAQGALLLFYVERKNRLFTLDLAAGRIREIGPLDIRNSANIFQITPDERMLLVNTGYNVDDSWSFRNTLSPLTCLDVTTGAPLLSLTGHQNNIRSVHVISGRNTVIAQTLGKDLNGWDLADGRRNLSMQMAGEGLNVSRDGRWGVTREFTTPVVLDLDNGKAVGRLHGHDDHLTSAEFSPGGKLLVSGSQGGTIKLWRTEKMNAPETVTGHGGAVVAAAANADGSVACTAADQVKLWDAVSGICLKTFDGYWTTIKSIYLSAVGDTVIANADDNLFVWDTKWGGNAFWGDFGELVAMSADGALAICVRDNHLVMWSTFSGDQLAQSAMGERALTLDRKRGDRDRRGSSWEFALGGTDYPFAGAGDLMSWALLGDAYRLVAGTRSGSVLFLCVAGVPPRPLTSTEFVALCPSCEHWANIVEGRVCCNACGGGCDLTPPALQLLGKAPAAATRNVAARRYPGYPSGFWLQSSNYSPGGYSGTCRVCGCDNSDPGGPPSACPSCGWSGS